MKKLIFLFICLIGIFTIQAQTRKSKFQVKGVLVDSLLNETEPYATIRVSFKNTPDKPEKLGVTDNNGKFSIPLTAPGEYTISLTSVGKMTVYRNFSITEKRPTVNLGTLNTAEETKQLKGVEVVAQKPLVKAEIDKISYSIEDDPDSKTNTTLEMLRKVPMVTVDGEDNIQVNGSSNFKVHVNGKPNTLMSNNPKEVLRSLPASSIKSIEVITEPGAKYDAEGIGGILNIITNDARMQGYNITLGANAGNNRLGGYVYGTVQVGKFTLSGNYSYNYSDNKKGYSSSEREDFTSNNYRFLNTEGTNKGSGNFQFGNIEGSYEIDSLNLITFSANMFGGNYKPKYENSTSMLNDAQVAQYSYQTFGRSKNGFGNIGINVDYQHSFKRKGEYFTVSYKYNSSPNNSESTTYYEDKYNLPFELSDQYFKNDAHTDEHTAQLDYVNPINDIHYFDAGLKYIYRLNSSDSKSYKEDANGNMQPDHDLSSKYDQNQNILAVYFDYQLKWKKLGFKAGVRYEHTFMDVKYDYMPERNFDANFNDMVPSASLSYSLGTSSNIRLNYNMRINRPGIWYLNPFRDTSNPTSISYGNPDLETEKSHNIGLIYSSFSAKFNLNANLNYMFINNGIEQYSFINDGIMETTYGNVGKTQQLRLSLWANWNPGNKTRISLNMQGRYADYKSDKLDAHNYGFSGNLFGNIQQALPWDLKLSLYGGGGTPSINLQGKGNSFSFYGLSLSRSFLKEKRLNISLYGSNIFNKYQTYSSHKETETFRSWSSSKQYNLSYGMSISWRFGELKAQVKKTARSINNDDVKEGGSSGGNSGGSSSAGGM
ncbi:outer membrane beta-barrel family protein [uncultured Bacteroides sp.]|uniref:outer membrane beta-barrel family protein n=1 Tax=uncultured Bacteroides sp. TaxID=162156 RepID=UPI00262BD327|nr:outer membrane beta-barrel family protein [uncultured Bacteroides sp.]